MNEKEERKNERMKERKKDRKTEEKKQYPLLRQSKNCSPNKTNNLAVRTKERFQPDQSKSPKLEVKKGKNLNSFCHP